MEWARTEKRTFLRQRIELRLASLYLESKNFQDALTLISGWVGFMSWHDVMPGTGAACSMQRLAWFPSSRWSTLTTPTVLQAAERGEEAG